MTLQMKQDTGGTVTLQAATSGTATATVPAIAGVVSVELKGADIASATTTDLSTATGDFVDVTGTTTITGLGTLAAGIERTVRFTGALTLTHNATSLILPGAANITTAANDRAIFRSLGSGNWICISYNKASGAAVVSSGGGLTNWSESAGTYSSKDWKRFYPVSGTNVNAIISPLGSGSFQLQVPDGSATGGNQRGTQAVDLQMKRSSASMVGSGTYSSIPGGKDNTVSGQASFTACLNNDVSGSSSFALGANNNISGSYAGGLSWGSTAGVNYSLVFGYGGVSGNIKGACVFSSGNIVNGVKGGSQGILVVLSRVTTDATAGKELLTMYAFGTSASTTNQILLSNNSTITFRAVVTAHRTDTLSGLTNRSSWVVQGVAYRDANAASTGVSSTVTAISNTPGYTLAVDADTTNGTLRFKGTGAVGHTIRWSAFVVCDEVKS